MWQKLVEPYVASGKLVAVGIVQEQHPDRARLYRQWRQLSWPILVDSLNLLDHAAVPIPMTLDESGVVRNERISTKDFVAAFLEKEFPKHDPPKAYARAEKPAFFKALREAKKWREWGDAEFLFGDLHQAIEAYERAVAEDPKDARAHFRLGVALRRRADGDSRKESDGQRAVEQWGLALALNPNQYIWRRRIQQYGPRLDKPYNFYFWVEEARKDIRARGEKPIELTAEPMGSEIAAPAKSGGEKTGPIPDADPEGKITRDDKAIEIGPVVTPIAIRPGGRIRVRLIFRVASGHQWNNEGDRLTVSPRLPEGYVIVDGELTHPAPASASSSETRIIEFEMATPKNASAGTVEISGYALYGICEKASGTCLYRRKDFKLSFRIDPEAPKYQ